MQEFSLYDCALEQVCLSEETQSYQHILDFSLIMLTQCLSSSPEISGGLRRGMAELWNPASLGTELGAGLK